VRRVLLQWLACPACRAAPLDLAVERARSRKGFATQVDVEDVLDGTLRCPDCQATYAVRQGIPRLLVGGIVPPQGSAHRWTRFDPLLPEWEQSFRDCASPLEPKDFLGKVVLDAGCGFGRHAYFAARYGADVIAMDAARDAVHAAQRNTQDVAGVHVVQGDVLRPPFRDGCFDIVYSFGVLHHVESPNEALEVLHGLLKSGGRLALWVYGPRQGLMSRVGDWMGQRTADLDPDELHRLSVAVAYGLRAGSHVPYRMLRRVPVAHQVVTHLPGHDHYRWPLTVVAADVYDRLKNPVRTTFTGEELEGWFARHGYASIAVRRHVRNNESFGAVALRR
jgi:SAM-dependent methyltransferase